MKINYLLPLVCILFVQCSSEETKSGGGDEESKALFEKTKKTHKQPATKLVNDVETFKELTGNFTGKENVQPKEKSNFKFAKEEVSSINSNQANSIMVRTLKNDVVDERPRNGFTIYSKIEKGVKDLSKTFTEVYGAGNTNYIKNQTKQMSEMLSHYPENLKYVFVLFETENKYPRVIGNGKFASGSYKATLFLYKVGDKEPIGIKEVSFEMPKVVSPVKLGAEWSVDVVHTKSIMEGVSKAISTMGELDGKSPKYQAYKVQVVR